MAAICHLGFEGSVFGFWTTHKEYWAAFITVHNLVGIDASYNI